MAEFTLPLNSKIIEGRIYKSLKKSEDLKILKIYRWNPEIKDNPRLDIYEIDQKICGPMVLDALIKIKDPREYYQKLIIHNNLKNYRDYLV